MLKPETQIRLASHQNVVGETHDNGKEHCPVVRPRVVGVPPTMAKKNRIRKMEEELPLFKYHKINKNLYALIMNHEIWFSSPKDFNDPFDCNLRAQPISSIEDAKKILKQNGIEELSSEIEDKLKDPDKFELIKNNLAEGGRELVSDVGVACFSYTEKSILMWSHYANYHKGVCLKFAPEYDPEFFRLTLDVEYTGHYPTIDLVNDELNVQISKAARYKHIDWKYEEEVRVLDFFGHGLKKFNIATLREIIFGCKSTEEDRGYLIRLVSKLGYEHIKFKLAKMKSDEFTLEFEEINTGEINRTNETIKKEIDKYLDSELKQMMRSELKEMAEKFYINHIGPKYEELVIDAVSFLISLKPEERNKFIDERLPLNQGLLKEIIKGWEEKNKQS